MIDAPGRAALAALLARPAHARLFDALDGAGEEARIVGGAVRNALIGEAVREVDFATTSPPERTSARAERAGFKVVPTGIEHGTLTLIVAGEPFEVTTLREDVETFGRRARVRFGRSFAADALRRDLTINALSLDRAGEVHDYAGGLSDLLARRVRFIGDPRQRLREDTLRILRFFRFHASYAAGPLDRAGFDAAIAERAGLDQLSRERVRWELLKLLAAPRAVETVATIAGAGFLGPLLGGVGDLGRLARAARFDAGGAPDPMRRLAALGVLVADDAARLRERLRLANAEEERLLAYGRAVARLRSRAGAVDERGARIEAAEHGATPLVDAYAALAGEGRPPWTDDAARLVHRFAAGAQAPPVFPLRGADLVARGVPSGPRIGALLARARTAWLAAGCPEGASAAQRLLEQVTAEHDS